MWTTGENAEFYFFSYRLKDVYEVILHVSKPNTKWTVATANMFQNFQVVCMEKQQFRMSLFSKDMTNEDFENLEDRIHNYKQEALALLRRRVQKDLAKIQGALLILEGSQPE